MVEIPESLEDGLQGDSVCYCNICMYTCIH